MRGRTEAGSRKVISKVGNRYFASCRVGRQDRSDISMFVFAAVLVGTLAAVAAIAGRSSGTAPSASGTLPAVDVTVTGTVGTQTNAGGETEYTLTTPDTTLLLDAGPAWFFGDAYPLAPFVGKQVTIGGEQREGSTQVDVVTVDGTALREPGKPPWAGGRKRVGERHPGWSQEKADRAGGQGPREAGALRARLLAAGPLQERLGEGRQSGSLSEALASPPLHCAHVGQGFCHQGPKLLPMPRSARTDWPLTRDRGSGTGAEVVSA